MFVTGLYKKNNKINEKQNISSNNESFPMQEILSKLKYYLEDKVAESKHGVAVFISPSLPPSLYIAPESIIYNDTTKFCTLNNPDALPEGLFSEEIERNPSLFSSYLREVINLHKMLKAGIKIIILVQESKLSALNDLAELVDDYELNCSLQKYKNLLKIIAIDSIPEGIADYYYFYGNNLYVEHLSNQEDLCDISQDYTKTANLNKLLSKNNIKPLVALRELSSVKDIFFDSNRKFESPRP